MPSSAQKLASSEGNFNERLRDALLYYPETGELWWATGKYVGRRAGSVGGSNKRRVSFEGKLYNADELIYRYMTGHWSRNPVRHMNGDKLDDSWKNLSMDPDGDYR